MLLALSNLLVSQRSCHSCTDSFGFCFVFCRTQYYVFNNDQIAPETLAQVLAGSEQNPVIKVTGYLSHLTPWLLRGPVLLRSMCLR